MAHAFPHSLRSALISLVFGVGILFMGAVHEPTQFILHLLLIGVLLSLVIAPPAMSKTTRRLSICVFAGAAILSIWLLPLRAGATLSLWPAQTIGALAAWTLFGGFAIGFSTVRKDLTKPDIMRLAVIGLVYLLGFNALIHAAFNWDALFGVFEPLSDTPLFIPPFINASHTASLMVWCFPVLLALPDDTLVWRRIRFGAVGLTVLLLALCASIGAAAALLGVGWFWMTRRQHVLLRWGGAAIGAGAGYGMMRTIADATRSQWEAQSFRMRQEIWTDTLSLIREYPLWGTGPGTYQQAYPMVSSHGLGTVSHAHSEVLHWWSELGFIGLVGMGLATLWFIRAERGLSGAKLGIWYGLLGLLLHSLVDFTLHIPGLTLLTIGSIIILMPQSHSAGPRRSSHVVRTAALLLLMFEIPAAGWTYAQWQANDAIRAMTTNMDDAQLADIQETLTTWQPWGIAARQTTAWQYERAGQRAEAQQVARQLALDHPNDPQALRQAGMILLRIGNPAEAEQVVHRATQLAPRDYRIWATASWISSALTKEDQARQQWTTAIQAWPVDTPSNPLKRALQLNPMGLLWLEPLNGAHPHWSHKLGDEMMQRREYDTAVLAYQQAKRNSPGRRDISLLGLALVYVGQEREGLTMLSELEQRYPHYSWISRHAAQALEFKQDHEGAAEAWMRAAQRGQGDEALAQCIRVLSTALQQATPEQVQALKQRQARCQALCETCESIP